MKVSSSGYYGWLDRVLSNRAIENQELTKSIDSKHNNPISPNLLARQFTVPTPDKYLVSDITYIPTKNGWLYLANRSSIL